MASPKTCSVCNQPSGNASYCREHKAIYQRDYVVKRYVLERGSGYREGVEAMRKTLSDEFERLGLVMVTCRDVAIAVRNAPAPSFAASALAEKA